jgi:glycosyltransferase involved in cell wall biosynthesis
MSVLVSVVVPVYNRGAAVAPTLDSVLAQTLPSADVELIVVDDGSRDGSADWIEAHYGARPNVRVVRQPNAGVAQARNRGLQEARGQFIAYLDHDDIWEPTKLQRQLEAFEGHPEMGVVYCLWNQITPQGDTTPRGIESRVGLQVNWPQGQVFAKMLAGNFIVSMSVPLIRTGLLREIGGFDPETAPCDDWDLWIRLAQRAEFGFVNEALVNYIQHGEQQSRNLSAMERAAVRLLRKNWRAIGRNPKAIWFQVSAMLMFPRTDQVVYDQARRAIAEGKWNLARRHLKTGIRHNPVTLLTPQWLFLLRLLVKRRARWFR